MMIDLILFGVIIYFLFDFIYDYEIEFLDLII